MLVNMVTDECLQGSKDVCLIMNKVTKMYGNSYELVYS